MARLNAQAWLSRRYSEFETVDKNVKEGCMRIEPIQMQAQSREDIDEPKRAQCLPRMVMTRDTEQETACTEDLR